LKAKVARETQEAKSIASQDAKVREEMAALDQHLAGVQSKLLILRQREGKLWLIPDKGFTTKEPILATVSGRGVNWSDLTARIKPNILVSRQLVPSSILIWMGETS